MKILFGISLKLKRLVPGIIALLLLVVAWANAFAPHQKPDKFKLLLFTKCNGYVHASIGGQIEQVDSLGRKYGFGVDTTTDSLKFTDQNLAQYSVIFFCNANGDNLLGDAGRAAFMKFIQSGKGYIGIHSGGADTEHKWPWYVKMVGALLEGHPQNAALYTTVTVVNHKHPSTENIADEYSAGDEWYFFDRDPVAESGVTLLERIPDHFGGTTGPCPSMWYHEYDGGRAWYFGRGHYASFFEKEFEESLVSAIAWAAGTGTTPIAYKGRLNEENDSHNHEHGAGNSSAIKLYTISGKLVSKSITEPFIPKGLASRIYLNSGAK